MFIHEYELIIEKSNDISSTLSTKKELNEQVSFRGNLESSADVIKKLKLGVCILSETLEIDSNEWREVQKEINNIKHLTQSAK